MPLPSPLFVRWVKLEITDAVGVVHAWQCSVTQAGLTSTGGDPVTLNTLCPEGSFSEATERAWSFTITGVQDVESADSLQIFLLEHDGELATFLYYPKVDKGGNPKGRGFTGSVTIVPPDNVGNAASGAYATFTASLPLAGKYTMVDQGGVPIVNKGSAKPGDVFPEEPTLTAEDSVNAAKLSTLGYVANPQTPWIADERILIGPYAFTWYGTAWGPGVMPDKGAAAPGDVFPTEPTVTASDPTNAAKLASLGYIAVPTTAWASGEKITVGTFDFNWSGTAWAEGAHALAASHSK